MRFRIRTAATNSGTGPNLCSRGGEEKKTSGDHPLRRGPRWGPVQPGLVQDVDGVLVGTHVDQLLQQAVDDKPPVVLRPMLQQVLHLEHHTQSVLIFDEESGEKGVIVEGGRGEEQRRSGKGGNITKMYPKKCDERGEAGVSGDPSKDCRRKGQGTRDA